MDFKHVIKNGKNFEISRNENGISIKVTKFYEVKY